MSYLTVPSAPISTLRNYELLGAALAQLSGDYLVHSGDFLENKLPPGWTEGVASGGSSALVGAVDGAQSSLISGATAGGLVQQQANAVITNINSTRWYCAWRQSVPNAVTSNARLGSGWWNGGASVFAGVEGGLSTTNFVVQYNGIRTGSALMFGAVDANMHVFEMWHPGDGLIHARQDGGVEQTGTAPNNASMVPLSEAYNNAAAQDHRLIRDWFVYLTGRS